MHEEWFEKLANELHITKVRQTKNFIEVFIPNEIMQYLKGDQLFYEVSQLSHMFRFSMKEQQLVITLDIVKLDQHFIYYLIDLLELIKKQWKEGKEASL